MTRISKRKKDRWVQMVEIVRSDPKDFPKDFAGLRSLLPDDKAGNDASLDETSDEK